MGRVNRAIHRNEGSLFKRQPHKMVKQTQTIQTLTQHELFECVLTFRGIGV